MCTICQELRPHDLDCPYAQGATVTGVSANTPTYSVDEVASFLTDGYWSNLGGPRMLPVGPGEQVFVDINALTQTGQTLARHALDAWSDVTGLQFVEQSSGQVDIRFDDEYSGAYASYSFSRGFIDQAFVNIDKTWDGGQGSIDSYHFQTYLHEIGHALGLGHGGPYNGSAQYGQDNLYANDSWQMSAMSYFSQFENTVINASYAYAITPMVADIVAVQSIYGASATRPGDTVYGEGANSGTYLDSWLTLGRPVALTIHDSGGYDRIDLSSQTYDQRIDLAPEAISDVQGLTGNLLIGRGTTIEEVATGSGADHVTGNAGDNTILLGGGSDTAIGGAGFDWIDGGSGDDVLWGGDQADTLLGGLGHDQLWGQNGDDRLAGDGGDDTLDGGHGDDAIWGGDGDDLLRGGEGADRLYGGIGDDLIDGDGGDDTLYGGAGEDTLRGGDGNDWLAGDAGFDWIEGGAGDDVLDGGAQADNLYGDAGADTLTGGQGFDRLFGGADADLLLGGDDSDALFGQGGDDTLEGGNGDDRLFGDVGNDRLLGDAGDDTLYGNAGFDTLEGGAGNDTFWGGFNADVFVFADGCGDDVIKDFDANNAYEDH